MLRYTLGQFDAISSVKHFHIGHPWEINTMESVHFIRCGQSHVHLAIRCKWLTKHVRNITLDVISYMTIRFHINCSHLFYNKTGDTISLWTIETFVGKRTIVVSLLSCCLINISKHFSFYIYNLENPLFQWYCSIIIYA